MNDPTSRIEDPLHRRLRICRLLVKERSRVGIHLGFELCPVPAWDMLLDLFIADHERRAVQIWSLCVASNIPTSTAHRKIGEMVDAGILAREAEGGRVMVRVTPAYRDKLSALLDDLAALIDTAVILPGASAGSQEAANNPGTASALERPRP